MSRYICPVCGYAELDQPAYGEGGFGSDEICPSCGYQFGITDDDEGISHEEWRFQWIASGMRWYGKGYAEPEGWDPEKQLEQLDKNVSN